MMHDKLQKIRMLLLDVDGVLTAGEIIYGDNGEEYKIFDVKDGLGVRMLKEAGLLVGIVTGRTGNALRHRCRNLGIELIFDGIRDKSGALEKITQSTGVSAQDMAFIGDDLPDLGIMEKDWFRGGRGGCPRDHTRQCPHDHPGLGRQGRGAGSVRNHPQGPGPMGRADRPAV